MLPMICRQTIGSIGDITASLGFDIFDRKGKKIKKNIVKVKIMSYNYNVKT